MLVRNEALPVRRPSAVDIEDWLIAHLATELKLEQTLVDPTEPFTNLGLDSISAVTITGDLEQWLGMRVSPTLAWDYPSIRDLAVHLASETGKSR